jgi:replicative DNA helicase
VDLSRNNIELMILGELFIDETNGYIEQVEVEWFEKEEHQVLFAMIAKLPSIRNDLPSMEFELKKEFYDKAKFYFKILFKATEVAEQVDNLSNHLVMLKEIYRNRQLENIYNGCKGEFTNENVAEIHKITEDTTFFKATPELKDLSFGYLDELQQRQIIHAEGKYQNMTGFSMLDNIIGGIMPKNLVVVGGRTSVGKSSLMTNMAVALAKNDRKVLYISCEMTESELFDRIISAESKVEAYKLRYGRLNDDEHRRVVAALGDKAFFEKNLWLHYKPGITMAGIVERVRKYNPDVLFFDHIQLIKPDNKDNLAQAISEAMNRLAGLAGENNIGIVVGSQMNRESVKEGAKGFEPVYFKGSGGIEENASVCCEIKMQDASQKEDMTISIWDMYIEITKNRHGRTGRMQMKFDRQILQFREVDYEAPKQSTFEAKPQIIRADWQ